MARFQGHNRLTDGFVRNLTKSEQTRGYIFVSKDKEIEKLKELEIFINGKTIGVKSIDNSGRISVGQQLTKDIGGKSCRFKLKGEKLFLEY